MFAEFLGSQGGAGYSIPYSVRLDGSADYFSRTPGSAGNRKTWTFSCWVKRGAVTLSSGAIYPLLSAGTGAADYHKIYYSDDYLALGFYDGVNNFYVNFGNTKYRDPSAWYHYVVVWDTTQTTPSLRFQAYCNGELMTGISASAHPSLNFDGYVCGTSAHRIGANFSPSYFSGYITHPILVDGTALTPSSFGETDATTGSWKPVAPSGLTYGTNGFWLDFSNTADLGNDVSGNNNDWTPNSLGSTDAVSDTPTNNFATLSYLNPSRSTLSNGNLTASGTTDLPTIVPSSGDWYFEVDGVAKNWTPPAAFPAAAGTYNFGQRAFSNTPTAGHKSLCTANLTAPSIKDSGKQMDVLTYTGNGAARTITGLNFQPDLVWIKSRSAATDHALYDSVRGVQKRLECNTTDVEATSDGGLTAFNSNGFDLGTLAQVNTNTATYVAWCWKAGGAAVANTDGTIASQVSANPTAGFSVVTYTGNGASSASFGHGLGSTPKLVIVKSRGEVRDWPIYHASLSSASNALYLNSSAAQFAIQSFNNTAPTATVVNVHWDAGVNNTNKSGDTYVAYCWAEVPGFSKFGSYAGNGSTDGPFINCGFRPRWVMVKKSAGATATNWTIHDTARSTVNPDTRVLYPDSSVVEDTNFAAIDVTSAGFKLRNTTDVMNTNGDTYIFAAFAEYPVGGLNTTPGKAR